MYSTTLNKCGLYNFQTNSLTLFCLEGVFFDNRVEHIKFVDFCGKYRIPLLQYLCSSKCIEDDSNSHTDESGACGYANSNMMKKVLLG
jgi:hypothetical protein